MDRPAELLDYFKAKLDASLDLLRAMVELESHSFDKAGIDALANFLAREFAARGAAVEILKHATRGNALRATWNAGSRASPLMMLGHLDTVWPRGTIVRRPFRLENGRVYGPGVFDMKGGILLCLLACEAFREKKLDPGKSVVFFFTADEEIGTEAGLPHLKGLASSCRAVLCLEPPLPGGKVKTFRKGVGEFRIRVAGVPAHAGVDHEKGASAILELSKLVIKLQALTDYGRGITVNVGKIRGGTATNVVPAEAEAEVDFRMRTLDDGRWLEEQIHALTASDPRCSLEVQGEIRRPPLVRTAAVLELYQRAREVACALGVDLGEGATGGGSDGSFTAAMGVATLDGLGVDGDGAHALDEHILLEDVPRRAALITELARRL